MAESNIRAGDQVRFKDRVPREDLLDVFVVTRTDGVVVHFRTPEGDSARTLADNVERVVPINPPPTAWERLVGEPDL